MLDFTDCDKIAVLNNAAVAATTDLDSGVIDLGADSGYQAVAAVYHFGTVTNAATIKIEVYGSENSDGSSPTKVGETDTLTYATGSDATNKLLTVQYLRPAYRYVFFRLKRATQNVVVNSVVAHITDPFRMPANNSGLLGGKVWRVLGI